MSYLEMAMGGEKSSASLGKLQSSEVQLWLGQPDEPVMTVLCEELLDVQVLHVQ